MSAVHPMVEKAARAWCKRHAEACGLDEAALWAEREDGFVTEAQAALEACGALELLEACKAMIRWDDAESNARPWSEDDGTSFRQRMEMCVEAFRKARDAFAKAEGRS